MESFIGKLGQWLTGHDPVRASSKDDVQVAAAALLLHAMQVDDDSSPEELDRVKCVLRERFALQQNELDAVLESATAEEDNAVDLYRFTKVLTANLEQTERQHIIRMMWDVVAADGTIHEFEANLVWRVAELIGVSTQDRIRLRQEVLAAVG